MDTLTKIFNLLDEEGKSQSDLAKALGISKQTITNWKLGFNTSYNKYLSQIADFLNVTVDYLLGKTSYKNEKELLDYWGSVNNPYFEAPFDFGKLIKEERESQGISLKDMSIAVGITEDKLNDIEQGLLPLDYGLAQKLAEYLGTSVSQLLLDNDLYDDEVPERYINNVDEWEWLKNKSNSDTQLEFQLVNRVKYDFKLQELIKKYHTLDKHGKNIVDIILNFEHDRVKKTIMRSNPNISEHVKYRHILLSEQPVSAGTGVFLDSENMINLEIIDNYNTSRADLAIPVSGDSMEPVFFDGDILLIQKNATIDIGEIGVFCVDGQGYVKKLGHNELISINSNYKPIKLTNDIFFFGKVIGVLDPAWIKK